MKAKSGQILQKGRTGRYDEKTEEQHLFNTSLWLGVSCLLIWLLMSVLL